MFAGASGLLLDDPGSLQVRFEEERQARMLLQSQVTDLQSKMRIFEESINSECTLKCPTRTERSVAFMAQLAADLVNPANGHVVVFNDVITNEGNGYNRLHGIFTAPVNGTYNFNLIVSSRPGTGQTLHINIKKDGILTGYIFLDHSNNMWFRRSTDITLRLQQGNEIWVEVTSVVGAHVLAGGKFHTHFSGFLISID